MTATLQPETATGGRLLSSEVAVTRLTALWAFSESGLGGLMHALKTPFTALTVGGLAILWMALIARANPRPARAILRALGLVLLVKAAVSPHSPLGAYFAVAFQGLLGALIFGLARGSGTLSAMLVAAPAMAESAGQKLLMATLVYGTELWEALDAFAARAAQKLELEVAPELSRAFALAYLGGYALAGLVIGALVGRFMAGLEGAPAPELSVEALRQAPAPEARRGRRAKVAWAALWMLGLLGLTAWMTGGETPWQKAGLLLLRALVVLTFARLLAPPLIAAARRWLLRSPQRREELDEMLAVSAVLRPAAWALWERSEAPKWRRGWPVLQGLIAFALTFEAAPREPEAT